MADKVPEEIYNMVALQMAGPIPTYTSIPATVPGAISETIPEELPVPASREALWETSREGAFVASDEAFTDLVEQYSDLAYNVALRMLRNPEDAEDAVQEAFISAYRAFPKFKGQSKLSTWLYRIVVNACLMRIRKEKTRSKYLDQTGYDDAVVRDWRNDPEQATINGELRDKLDQGLQYLSADLRTAVTLRDIQGFSTEEAADMLGITVASLKSRLHRGRVLLRKHLEQYLAKAA